MWADNETDTDLLGFSVHEQLLRGLVTNPSLLPVTVGVFGDWGSGKSSVLRMLRKQLLTEVHDDVLCLYFDGWTLEGYDDAKAALMSSILVQLGENKQFGPKIRDKIAALLKLVNFMHVISLGIKTGAGPLIGWALGSGLIDPQTGAALATGAGAVAGSLESSQSDNSEYVDWQQLIEKDQSTPSPLTVRLFQEQFKQALDESGVKSLVVLIDNLDRCAPDRLVENLEAIKLFLAVPKTAFVIAADEWIVRYAISSRYATGAVRDHQSGSDEPRDLAQDYLEKLIQVRYHLPRLSPSEIESYITLLACQIHLDDDGFCQVQEDCARERAQNLYATYGGGNVRSLLGGSLSEELERQLQWTSAVAPQLAEGLKGNPRQVKRFLNGFSLRRGLGEIAKLGLRDDVLVKLMLLEYTHPVLFDQLYEWQATSNGKPEQLRSLEEQLRDPEVTTETLQLPPGAKPEWGAKSTLAWLGSQPTLVNGHIDLRDYFWVARDRLQGTVSGMSMLSPAVRTVFEQLVSPNQGERQIAAAKAAEMRTDDLAALLELLGEYVRTQTQDLNGVDGLIALAETGMTGAWETALHALGAIPADSLIPGAAFKVQRIAQTHPDALERASALLENWAKTKVGIGVAAKTALRGIAAGGGSV